MIEFGVGDALGASGNAAYIPIAGHAAASIDFGFAQVISSGILDSGSGVPFIKIKAVVTPFIHIATHVVDPQFVRHLCADSMKYTITVVIAPSHIFQHIRTAKFVIFG